MAEGLVMAADVANGTASAPTQAVLDRLERVQKTAAGWSARCPAHDDGQPSLSVREGDDGRCLLHCHAGCAQEEIVGALGLTMADLFERVGTSSGREPERVYPYVDEEGTLLFEVCRLPGKTFRQRRPDPASPGGYIWKLEDTRRVLYRLPRVVEAVAAGQRVYVVEGEKDVDALERRGAVATCNPGGAGAGKWRDEYSQALRGADVVVVADRDQPGQEHAATVHASLVGKARSVSVVQAASGKDAADHLAAGHGLDEFQPVESPPDATSANGSSPHAEDWPRLPEPVLPTFPLDALPNEMADWAAAVAEESQTPPDLAALAGLGVLSAAALGGPVVDCGAWEEELALYILVAMPSGDRKSAVLRAALAPLLALEAEWREQAGPGFRDHTMHQEILAGRAAKLTKKAIDHPDQDVRDEAIREVQLVRSELEALGEPVLPRLVADDATPEALGHLLAQYGRIAVITGEASLLDNLAGQYNDGAANFHLVCKAYAGEPARIDRRSREPEQLDRPLLALTFTVQPHVLANLVSNKVARSQGLVSRFAYALPETRLGSRKIETARVPPAVTAAWAAVVRHVSNARSADRTDATPDRGTSVSSVSGHQEGVSRISLSPEARHALSRLRADLEPRLAEAGDLRPFSDWANRHPGRVARVAGLLHLAARKRAGEAIAESTLLAAERIGDCLLVHGLTAVGESDPKMRTALRFLARHDGPTVSQRELHRGPLASRGTADDANSLVQTLIKRGAIRPGAAPRSQGGRPPSPTFEINPHLRPEGGSR